MRLPWPFSRPQPSSAADTAADATQVFAARPRGPQAWRELPVLATSVGTPPLVAPTPPFRADLAGAAAAPIVLAPLTHGRGIDAPHGLVSNVAQASPAHAAERDHDSTLTLAPRPHQRSEVDAGTSLVGTAETNATAVSPSPAQGMGLPGRRAPVVDQRAPERPHLSFVSAASQPSLTLPPSGTLGRPAAVGQVQRAPATPAQTSSLEPSVTRPATPAVPSAAAPEAPAPARPVAERLTLGQARRLGLGAPIDPVAFRGARSQAAPELVLSAPAEKSAPPAPQAPQAPLDAQPAAAAASISAPRISVADRAAPKLPDPAPAAPLRARPTPAAAVVPAQPRPAARTADVARPAPSRAHVQRAPRAGPTTELPALPILGARPLVPGPQLAAAAARPATSTGTTQPGAPEPAGSVAAIGVRIHRGPEAADVAGALDARAFTRGTDIYLPQSHGPLSGPKAQALLAHEMTHVAQQRRLGASLPAEDSAHGQQLEAQAAAAERAGQLPLASAPDKSHDAPPQESPQTLTWTMPGASAAASPAAGAAQPAQRAPEAKFTDPDDAFRAKLDSNEEYLFGRLERRLRRQLIGERERGGTLIDAL